MGHASERPADGSRGQGVDRPRRPAHLGGRAMRSAGGSVPIRRRVSRLEDGSRHQVQPGRQGCEKLRRRHVHLAARARRGRGRQRLGQRRGGRQPNPEGRQTRADRCQVQSGREGVDDAGRARTIRERPRSLYLAERCRDRSWRRHLRRRRPQREWEQPRREVFKGREVHQVLGEERLGARRVPRPPRHRDGFKRTHFRRRPREQPHFRSSTRRGSR